MTPYFLVGRGLVLFAGAFGMFSLRTTRVKGLAAIRRGYDYELLVASGNLLQSPLLLVLRVYFFWQLFMTGTPKALGTGFFISSDGLPASSPTYKDWRCQFLALKA
jgi:hypothetical protein